MSAQIIQFPRAKNCGIERRGTRADVASVTHQQVERDVLNKRFHQFLLKRGIIRERSR